MFPPDWYVQHQEAVANVIGLATSAIAVGCFWYAVQNGGIHGIEQRMRCKDADRATEAKAKIRRGLSLISADGPEEDHCVDALIAGFDEWRRYGSGLAARKQRLRRAKLALIGVSLLGTVSWVLSQFGPGIADFLSTMFWVPMVCWAVANVYPIASELVDHGLPEPTSAPKLVATEEATSADDVIQRGEAAKAPRARSASTS